ncbi:unnamed protein product, partial [Iphiclides podalirius]
MTTVSSDLRCRQELWAWTSVQKKSPKPVLNVATVRSRPAFSPRPRLAVAAVFSHTFKPRVITYLVPVGAHETPGVLLSATVTPKTRKRSAHIETLIWRRFALQREKRKGQKALAPIAIRPQLSHASAAEQHSTFL